MNADHARRRGDQTRHRPQIVEVRIEAGDRQLSEVGADVRVVPLEFQPIVGFPAGTKERRRASVMEVRVVKDRKARIA